MFVNNNRAIRARSPNTGYHYTQGVDPIDKDRCFLFKGADINANWKQLTSVEVVSYRLWEQSRHTISSVNGNKVCFSGKPTKAYDQDYAIDTSPIFGLATDVPIVFEDAIGYYRDGEWLFEDGTTFSFGGPGQIPVVGDFNGDGIDNIGVYADGVWELDLNDNQILDSNETVLFGLAGDIPVVGDWNGDGRDKIGIVRNGIWNVDYDGDYSWNGTVDWAFGFGEPTDIPVVGDWNGDGVDQIGVFRAGIFWLDTNHPYYQYDSTDKSYGYSAAKDIPSVGDWNGDGKDNLGAWRDGQWFLDIDGDFTWSYGTNGRYYVENAFELLDSPGEWYLDRTANKVYYWPKNGENIGQSQIIAGQLQQLVELKNVNHVLFKGINFFHTDWQLPSNGYPGGQAGIAITTPSAISLENSNSITIENNKIAHIGAYATSSVCSNNAQINHNEIFDAGAGGIKVGEFAGTQKTSCLNNPSMQHTISNNKIYDSGRVYKDVVGIWIMENEKNSITNNLIYNSPYSGISLGWNWCTKQTNVNSNIVEHNIIHDVMQELNDGAGIYTVGRQPGTKIKNNIIHDITFTNNHNHNVHLYGIYLDQGTSEMEVRDNIVYRIGEAPLMLHYTFDNIISNNIFVDGDKEQLQYVVGDYVDFCTKQPPSGNIFEKNIVYYTSNGKLYYPELINPSISKSDNNIYFNTQANNRNFNLEWWKNKYSFDSNSLVADPMFVGYAQDNFALRQNSPAFSLGFQGIDTSQVGLQQPIQGFCGNDICELNEGQYGCPADCTIVIPTQTGDFNNDQKIDILDIRAIVSRISTNEIYDPIYDLNLDGEENIKDLLAITKLMTVQ